MPWPLFFFCILLSSWVLPISAASFGTDIQRNAVCAGGKIAEDKLGHRDFEKSIEGIYKAAESQQPSLQTVVAAQALQLEAARINFIQQNRLSPDASGEKPYRQETDEKGNPVHIFTIMSNMSKKWVEKVCGAYYPEIQSFCVDSFYKRRENVKSFLDQHKSRIETYAQSPPSGGETWAEKMGGETFERDAVTDGNLRWNASPYLPTSTMDRLGGVPTTNDKNQLVGYMVQIEVEGKAQFYFAEATSEGVLWPYFFIFGSPNSDEWNKIFEKKHGSLKVGELPLSQWIQMRDQLAQKPQ
mgnify:CR=1 FL=1